MSEPRRPAAAQSAAIERWSLPEVDGPVVGRLGENSQSGRSEAASAALRESEARGYQAGLARAQAQMQAQTQALDARVRQLEAVCQLLANPLRELDGQVEKELLQLALAVGKQLARRELRVDPAQVIAIIRESLNQLPASAREVRVHLHPQDAATVRERLASPSSERAWTMVEDPTLSPGGCVVRTETSQIDARLESRVNAMIAAALGEERAAPTVEGES